MSETGPPDEESPRPSRHRAAHALRSLLAPVAAVAVVVVVIVLLLVINGHSSKGTSNAAGKPPAPATTPTRAVAPTPSPGRSRRSPVATPSPVSSHSHRSSPAVAVPRAPVQVLNNSRRTGLAHQVAAELQGRGWTVSTVGNLQGRLAETTVYYARGDAAAAADLAHDFGSIRRVEPEAQGGLHGVGLTLVLTRDWVG